MDYEKLYRSITTDEWAKIESMVDEMGIDRKAGVIWFTCTMGNKSDFDFKLSMQRAQGIKMAGFLNLLTKALSRPFEAAKHIHSLKIGSKGTYAEMIFNDGGHLIWQESDCPPEADVYILQMPQIDRNALN